MDDLLSATYMSGNELERAVAFNVGYRAVCQHPNEIGVLESSDVLVLDMNQVLFDDHALAVEKVVEAARRGVLIGIHTYYPEDPKLQRLAELPNVLVAKNHCLLLLKLGRYAKLHGRPWQQFAKAAKFLKGEVFHVHNHDEQGTVGHGANVPAGAGARARHPGGGLPAVRGAGRAAQPPARSPGQD